jgi:HPt (histidine-containing phosphotransfer) domain-containing protein
MIDLFCSHAEPKLGLARESYDAGELEAVERAAHSIRSSAGNVGAEELREIAGRIETLASKRDHAGLLPLLSDLDEAFQKAKAILEQEKRGRTHDESRGG